MLHLSNDELAVTVDVDRGAAIRSITCRRTGAEILYQAHWPLGPLAAAADDESAWIRAWGGGWNVLFPNAGAACVVNGERHPMHGAASIASWHQPSNESVMRWFDADGLWIERRVVLDGRRVSVTNTVGNAGSLPANYLVVEHIIFGEALIGPEATVHLPGGMVVPLADDGTPLPPPAASHAWPDVVRDGTHEDWARRPEQPASRFGVVVDLPDRWLKLNNPTDGLAVRMRWSSNFPYLWFWEERAQYSDPPWDNRVRCLGLEPATAPTSEGLGVAAARGEAPLLGPGDQAKFWTELELLH